MSSDSEHHAYTSDGEYHGHNTFPRLQITDASTSELTSNITGLPQEVGAPPVVGVSHRDDFNAAISGSTVGGTSNHNIINNNNSNSSNHYHYYASPGLITGLRPTESVSRPSSISLPTGIIQAESASDAYARILLAKKIGYPLWTPEPSEHYPEYQRDGIGIGDVGVIVFDGRFDFLFNICLPADHPVNRQAPPGFEPLKFNQDEFVKKTPVFHPGRIIASTAIEIRSPPDIVRFEFTCFSTEGALLVLPDGASRTDLRFRHNIQEYAKQHFLSWYQHVHGTLGLEAEAGDLYLITGVDKCKNWCLGSYSNFSREMSLGFTPTNVTPDNTTRSYTWESSGPVDARTCFEPGQEINQCVFIRGYRMSLRKSLLKKILLGPVKISDIIPPNPSNITEGGRISGSTALGGWFSSLGGNRGGSQPRDAEPGITGNTIAIESFPELSAPYHPSNAINSHLLDANPDAQVAITHDDEWCAVIEEEDSMPNEPELLRRIIEKYNYVGEAGCVFLVPKDNMDTGIHSMALEGSNLPAPSDVPSPSFYYYEGELDVAKPPPKMGTYIGSRDKGDTPLHFAALSGNEVELMLHIKEGADINTRNNAGITPVHCATLNGHEAALILLIENGADVNACDRGKMAPIHSAAKREDEAALKILIEGGADINVRDSDGIAPLHHVAGSGNEAMVRLLIERGADIESRDKDLKTPLRWAAESGNEAMVRLLLEKGADVQSRDKNLKTPLRWAAERGDAALALVRVFVEASANINISSFDGTSPLHWIAGNGNESMARLLVEKGADIELRDCNQKTPLHWAAERGRENTIKLLVEVGADINVQDFGGTTPLHYVSETGKEAMIRLFLEKGADIESRDINQKTPLHWATKSWSDAAIRVLLEKGANMESRDGEQKTPLHCAADRVNEAGVKLLIENGADINVRDFRKITPLHLIAETREETMVRFLVEKGADIESQDDNLMTSLHWAAEKGSEAVIRLLVEYGADINRKEYRGITPLHWVVKRGYEAIVRLLLDEGADIESRDSNLKTPLHWAVVAGCEDIVRLLVDSGADIDVRDVSGKTPLRLATESQNTNIIQLLVENGANTNAEDSDSQTPWDRLIDEELSLEANDEWGLTARGFWAR